MRPWFSWSWAPAKRLRWSDVSHSIVITRISISHLNLNPWPNRTLSSKATALVSTGNNMPRWQWNIHFGNNILIYICIFAHIYQSNEHINIHIRTITLFGQTIEWISARATFGKPRIQCHCYGYLISKGTINSKFPINNW